MHVNQLDAEYVLAVCQAQEAQSQAAEIVATSQKISSSCEDLLEASRVLQASNGIDEQLPAVAKRWDRNFSEYLFKIKQQTFCLYSLVNTPSSWSNQRNLARANVDDYVLFNQKIEGIYSDVLDDSVYVKLPLLGETITGFNANKKRNYPVTHYQFFVQSLDASLTTIDNKIPPLCEKNITILYVYHPQRKDIFDTDNHDTKAIVDVICKHTLGGDAALSCSFFYASIRSEELPEGTYFVVSPGFGVVPGIDIITHNLRTLLSHLDEAPKSV